MQNLIYCKVQYSCAKLLAAEVEIKPIERMKNPKGQEMLIWEHESGLGAHNSKLCFVILIDCELMDLLVCWLPLQYCIVLYIRKFPTLSR